MNKNKNKDMKEIKQEDLIKINELIKKTKLSKKTIMILLYVFYIPLMVYIIIKDILKSILGIFILPFAIYNLFKKLK